MTPVSSDAVARELFTRQVTEGSHGDFSRLGPNRQADYHRLVEALTGPRMVFDIPLPPTDSLAP